MTYLPLSAPRRRLHSLIQHLMKINLNLLQTTVSDNKPQLTQMLPTPLTSRTRITNSTTRQHHITHKLLSLTRHQPRLINKIADPVSNNQRSSHSDSLRSLPERIEPLLKLTPDVRRLQLVDPATMTLGIPTLILSANKLTPRRTTRLKALVVPTPQNLDTRIPPQVHSLNRTSPILRESNLLVQRAQERLPERDASLADQLFVLECAARGGRAVLPTVERYRPALREAEWWLDETWEPDVPHAAVVGQALSAANALDVDPPSSWPDLLGEAITALERRRQGRFGIGGDPSLLAVVLRGLDAAHMRAPEWLLTDAAGVLNERRSSEATAELADALARHQSGQPLVANAVAAAFRADEWTDADAPYAR